MIGGRRLRIDSAGRVWRGRERLELRPKARLLLAALHAEPGRIMDRETLCHAVWGHDHVEPQALFQLVSEIRSAVGDRDCIATYPNRGYAWAMPARSRSPRTLVPILGAAAAAVLGLVGALLLRPLPATDGLALAAAPALSAFERGLSMRADGRNDAAIESLRLAVREYPRFGLAKLELARSLAVVGASEEALGLAHDALSDARIADDAYLAASANLLLSHLSWLHGDLARASLRGRAAADIADREGFLCVAEESRRWNQRLAQALTSPDPTPLAPPDQRLADCRRAHEVKPQTWVLPATPARESFG